MAISGSGGPIEVSEGKQSWYVHQRPSTLSDTLVELKVRYFAKIIDGSGWQCHELLRSIPSLRHFMSDPLSKIRDIFAKTIALKVKALDVSYPCPNESKRVRGLIIRSIDGDIRIYTDLIRPSASEAAQKEADLKSIELADFYWRDQPKFDKGKLKFHLEHYFPVSGIRNSCIEAKKWSDIASILEKANVVWVLKEEDKELRKLGFNSVRPDPEHAYAEARIKIVNPNK